MPRKEKELLSERELDGYEGFSSVKVKLYKIDRVKRYNTYKSIGTSERREIELEEYAVEVKIEDSRLKEPVVHYSAKSVSKFEDSRSVIDILLMRSATSEDIETFIIDTVLETTKKANERINLTSIEEQSVEEKAEVVFETLEEF